MNKENKLIRGCQKGNKKSFSILYEFYFQKIYNYIYYKTYHKETAEDITSNTFMKAFTKIQNFDLNKGKILAWLYTIAKNDINDFYRKKHKLLSIDDIWDIKSEENIEIDAINRENFISLQRYIQDLPEYERDILIMRVWQELQFQEIAVILDKNEGQCKMTFYRMIKKMKEEIPANIFILLAMTKYIIK